MLAMPQMIQTWKEVCIIWGVEIYFYILILCAERSWTWMEEVAQEIEDFCRRAECYIEWEGWESMYKTILRLLGCAWEGV